jgi:sec-independent protein translocase protein TatB
VFDLGFSELMVVGVVALVVIGPERLPKVARTAGALLGRMQRYVADVKADINREIEASELKSLKATMDDAASSINSAVAAHASEIEQEIRKTEQEFDRLSNPLLHFGLAGGAAGNVSSGENRPDARAADGVTGDEPESSQQLELGFSGSEAPPTGSVIPPEPISQEDRTAS